MASRADLQAKVRRYTPTPSETNGPIPKTNGGVQSANQRELHRQFARYKQLLDENFVIDDWQGVEVIAAAAMAHYVRGEMLWLRVIGASRSGKTEMIRPFEGHPDTETLGVMTPASIQGGFRGGNSVLERVNGSLVLTEDLAGILTMKHEQRTQLFGLLRSVKDGKIDADFNTAGGHVSVTARFDWILCTTWGVERHRSLDGLLGQRFIDLVYRWNPSSGVQMAEQAQFNNATLGKIRRELSECAHAMLDSASEDAKNEAPDLDTSWIARLASAVARARTTVDRDPYTKRIEYLPTPEAPTSLAQDFNRLAQGMRLLGLRDYRPYLVRVAWDCLPNIRSKILRLIADRPWTEAAIATKTGLAKSTVSHELEAMRLLRLIDAKNELRRSWVADSFPKSPPAPATTTHVH